MRTFLVAFLLAFGAAAASTPLLRKLALRWGWLDRPDARKIHAVAVPRIGGVALVGAFYLPLVGLYFRGTGIASLFWADRERAVAFFAGGLIIALLGIYDDLKGADAGLKFLVQFGVASLMYAAGFRVEILANPFGDANIPLGILSLPFTLLWIVGVINALNFVDGLDGLASGVAFFAVTTTFVIAFGRGELLMCLYMATIAGAILGFLFYNFNPATIFMGDTGSMFLGFVLAVSAIQTNQKSSTAVALLIPIVALGLPIMDTLLAVVRRLWTGRPVFSADRDHIHHRLLALGFTHRQAVLTLYGVTVALCAVALVLTFANSRQVAFLLAGVGLAMVVLVRRLGYLRLGVPHGGPERGRLVRRKLDDLGRALAAARSEAEVWRALRSLALGLGANRVTLELMEEKGDGDERRAIIWRAPGQGDEGLVVRLPLQELGELVLAWRKRTALTREEEALLADAAEQVAEALERLRMPDNVVRLPEA